MTFSCPVCGYATLRRNPMTDSHEICPSCGTQFGYTDFNVSHDELRAKWWHAGAHWQSAVIPRPSNWNAARQLLESGILFTHDDIVIGEEPTDVVTADAGFQQFYELVDA